MKNWKTSIIGLALILVGAYILIQGKTIEGGALLTAGLGFLGAKDHNAQ